MTMREIVAVLRQDGLKVEYRPRSDGGILITRIGDTKFTGAAGNNLARTLVGGRAALSSARKTQLKIIKPEKGKRPKFDLLDENLKAKIKEVQKTYTKNKVPISQGRITRRLIRKILREEGREAALKKLEQAERYASGYAISKVVQALVDYVRHTATLMESDELDELADDIEDNDGNIRDEYIKPAYDELYKLNKGADVKDVCSNVRTILRIN